MVEQGLEEGRKDRPCAVVFAVENQEGKPLLRLDDRPSWIITSELNHFEWPGPHVVGSDTSAITRGFLPHKVVVRLREMILARIRDKSIRPVDRDFDVAKAQAGMQQSKDPKSR